MMQTVKRVFISHAASDAKWLADLKRALRAFGLDGFLAHEDIEPDSDWADQIRLALQDCEFLVVFWSPDAIKSAWVSQEVGYALGRGIPVISAKCGAAPVGLMGHRQAMFTVQDWRKDQPRDLARQVFGVLEPELGDQAVACLVSGFVDAGSYEAAADSINALRDRAERISDEQIHELQTALEGNYHCRHSYIAEDRVDEIIARRDAAEF